MKKLILSLVAIVAIAIPAMASMPADGYGTELRNRDEVSSTIKPQYEINVGYISGGKINRKVFGAIDTNFSRPYIDAIVSARLSNYLSLGVGVGLEYAYEECKLTNLTTDAFPETWDALCIPIFANVKAHYPVSELVAHFCEKHKKKEVAFATSMLY